MTRSMGKRRFHYKNVQPADPAVKSLRRWPQANQLFFDRFRRWLCDGGYGESAIKIYSGAARLALGWLDKPYWEIDAQTDLDRVRAYVNEHYSSETTRNGHIKGLAKLAEFLRLECRQSPPVKQVNWRTYLGVLPGWLAGDVRAFVAHRRRAWLREAHYRSTQTCLSHLTQSLRWMARSTTLHDIGDVTPELWYAYVDHRLANAISAVTINIELGELLMFLRFLDDAECAENGSSQSTIDTRMLHVEPLKEAERLPRDVPVGQLRRLLGGIEAAICSDRADERYKGLMDKAWFHLMLLGGLRTGEIRRLRRIDIDFESRRITIERSKGLKDRVICIGQPVVDALHAYLGARGAADTKHVFLFRHKPLSTSYCGSRLRTYGERCGVVITPHQLRHSFSTMLLNAGVPIPVLQKLLGHKNIETTLQYTRLYDSTVATGYYRAMDEIEGHFDPGTEMTDASPSTGELLAMLNTLQASVLSETQQETVRALRAAILAMGVVQGADDDNLGNPAT